MFKKIFRHFKANIVSTLVILAVSMSLLGGFVQAEVLIQSTPDEGLQPRLIVDDLGGVHLLYFKKRINRRDAREGNLYYRQYLPEQNRFGNQVRVSSQAFNMQAFAIARAAMAVDGDGRLHVMWYLPSSSEFFYSRSNLERSRFEPQQSMVSEFAEGIDASGDIAAFGSQVAIVWGAGDLTRESERTMFARLSHDGGASFGEERRVSNPQLGACACCTLATDYLDSNQLLIAYRSAIDGIGRHMQLLTIDGVDKEITGASYGPVHALQEWEVSFCPLSTNDIAIAGNQDRWLVFETESRIVQLNLASGEPSLVGEPFKETRQKHPAIAFNNEGQRLVVWGEAISQTRGGRLNMRLFDETGPVDSYQFTDEIDIGNYSFPAAAPLPDGNFLVLY